MKTRGIKESESNLIERTHLHIFSNTVLQYQYTVLYYPRRLTVGQHHTKEQSTRSGENINLRGSRARERLTNLSIGIQNDKRIIISVSHTL